MVALCGCPHRKAQRLALGAAGACALYHPLTRHRSLDASWWWAGHKIKFLKIWDTSRVQEREANCFRAKPAAQDNAAVPVLAYSVTLASSSAEPQPSRGERESCWEKKKDFGVVPKSRRRI